MSRPEVTVRQACREVVPRRSLLVLQVVTHELPLLQGEKVPPDNTVFPLARRQSELTQMISAPFWMDSMCFRFNHIRVDSESQVLLSARVGPDLRDIICAFVTEDQLFEEAISGLPMLLYLPFRSPEDLEEASFATGTIGLYNGMP